MTPTCITFEWFRKLTIYVQQDTRSCHLSHIFVVWNRFKYHCFLACLPINTLGYQNTERPNFTDKKVSIIVTFSVDTKVPVGKLSAARFCIRLQNFLFRRYLGIHLNERLHFGEHIYYVLRQAGTGPSRRHIQSSKIAKRLPSVKYSLLQYSKIENFSKKNFRKKLHTQKNGPSGAPGPASASPWRAKRGTLPKLSTFLSQLKGNPLEKKQTFGKKSHSAEKN